MILVIFTSPKKARHAVPDTASAWVGVWCLGLGGDGKGRMG